MGQHVKTEEELRADWDAAVTKADKLRALANAFVATIDPEEDPYDARLSAATARVFRAAAEDYEANGAEVYSELGKKAVERLVGATTRAVWKMAKEFASEIGDEDANV